MAKAMNIAPSYLCEIEKGRRDPGPEFFIKFAWIYHVNLNFLFFDAVDMFVDDEGVIKKEDLDISTEIDTIQKVTWFMENSVHIKSLIFMTLNKALYFPETNPIYFWLGFHAFNSASGYDISSQLLPFDLSKIFSVDGPSKFLNGFLNFCNFGQNLNFSRL
ncbi:MAG: helix-turn-helix transcriptional regulator [Acidobacteria bacterium]|nr:helix-turn-helix transcriptional regulator [Acidobacteriota bacterium]